MDGFGKRLKRIRENKKIKDPKWTQEFVADAIGVARSTYTAYENGTKQPPLETVNKIADLFETNVDYLLGRTDDPTPITNRQYEVFLAEIKKKYPSVNLDDPDIRQKLMKAIDLVLDVYRQKQ